MSSDWLRDVNRLAVQPIRLRRIPATAFMYVNVRAASVSGLCRRCPVWLVLRSCNKRTENSLHLRTQNETVVVQRFGEPKISRVHQFQ